MSFKVQVKWGKEKFTLELNTEQPPSAFKEAIYQKTGVPVERQKIMAPKAWTGTLKESWIWKKGSCQLKDGSKVNVVGTSTGVPEAPKTQVVFVEDMSVEDKASSGASLPPGLVNLGNTCYMNATVQALASVPELREALAETPGFNLGSLLGKVFAKMQRSTEPLKLEIGLFWQQLQSNFPQYAERGPNGIPKQQDADEFLSNLFGSLKDVAAPPSLNNGKAVIDRNSGAQMDVASALFGLTMETTLTCQENVEVPVVKHEKSFKIICNIDGGGGAEQHINHLAQGLFLGLEGQVEKHSEGLGRNALYKRCRSLFEVYEITCLCFHCNSIIPNKNPKFGRVSRIDRLPRYVCVQFMRFFWKATPESRDHEGVRCKILRRVKFAETLDIYEFCSDRLKAQLKVQRDKDAAEIFAQNEAADKERQVRFAHRDEL